MTHIFHIFQDDMMDCINRALPNSLCLTSKEENDLVFKVVPNPLDIIIIRASLPRFDYLTISKIKVYPLRTEVDRGNIFKGQTPTADGAPDFDLIFLLLLHYKSIG